MCFPGQIYQAVMRSVSLSWVSLKCLELLCLGPPDWLYTGSILPVKDELTYPSPSVKSILHIPQYYSLSFFIQHEQQNIKPPMTRYKKGQR